MTPADRAALRALAEKAVRSHFSHSDLVAYQDKVSVILAPDMLALLDEVERLREAVAHYACEEGCNECGGDTSPLWCGAKARAALEQGA